MLRQIKSLFTATVTTLTGLALSLTACAGLPETGDGSGAMMPVIYGLIGLGVVLVVVYVVLSRKKK